MKIVFDANPLAATNKTGVGMYTKRLIEALAASDPQNIELVGYYFNFLGRKKPELPEGPNITYKQVRLYPGQLANALRRLGVSIPVEFLSKTLSDVALYPNFIAQPSLFKTKSYAVLHDLSYIAHPEYASDKNRKDLERFVPKTIKQCAGLLTVSEVSKQVICETYDYPADKILVTPIAPEQKLEVSDSFMQETKQKFGITKPYVLFLGTLEPRKNLVSLLTAYEQNTELNSKFQLVLAGGTDWKFEEITQKMESMRAAGLGVVHCGYVSMQERAALYAGAEVFVLPSHEEGFGMMILESMQYNTPVAVSNIPVFHEVSKDAALFFDQNNPADIAKSILTIVNSDSVKEELNTKARAVLATYDWTEVARSVLKFI